MEQDIIPSSGFETVFRNSIDGLAIYKNGVFTDCNQSMLDLLQLENKNEFIGLTPFDFSPEYQFDGQPSLEKGMEKINECLEKGSVRFEWVFERRNGETFWAEVIITMLLLDDEAYAYANWRDITKQKELEKKLAEQRDTFAELFNESVDGLAIYDGSQYTDCNDAFLELFGIEEKAQAIGLTPIDLSPEYQPDGRLSLDAAKDRIAETADKDSVRFEWVHKKIDGTPFWTEVILTKIKLNGLMVSYASIRDISEKKELELQLGEQRNSFETLFSESVDGLCVLEGETYVDCNRAFLKLFGFKSKDELIGLNPMDITPEYQEEGVLSHPLVPLRLGQTEDSDSVRFEWKHKKVDGTEFWAEIILTRITLNGKNVRYAITRDISEKKSLEIQLQEQNRALNHSNAELEQMLTDLKQTQQQLIDAEKMASLGSLVAGVAHEINTPVGVGLLGITQFIDESRELEEHFKSGTLTESKFTSFIKNTNELAALVKNNLDRTAQLVKGFKQIAVDQTNENDRRINIKTYINEIIISLSSVVKKSRISVDVSCNDDIQILINPSLIYQVLSNLIMNSKNHGFKDKDTGHINIEIKDNHTNTFQLIYRDDGKGISKDNLPKIFNPFFTTNRANGGTGLGLNVTYNIVTSALGGTIECHSEENEGVEFVITFKVKERY